MRAVKPTVFLVDGSALFYRAYFAFIRNPLINSKGENTSATFGLVSSLLKLIREERPDYLAIVFDTKEPTFRHKAYPDYKATRSKMPDDLVVQLPRIREAVEALSIPSFEMVGYEADDIIGTIAFKAEAQGCRVWCVTGDKDFFQLVTDDIWIYTPRSGAKSPDKLGPAGVEAKFGVRPELVIDKLALMGDSSDNVPGVPGIGPVSAGKLLKQFGSLQETLDGFEQIAAKGIRQKIAANVDKALLSQKLVTIDTNVPIPFELEQIKSRQPNYEVVRKLFIELEFTHLLKELRASASTDEIKSASATRRIANYQVITSVSDLKDLVVKLANSKEVAVDTETTSLDTLEAELVGVSLCAEAGRAYYVPLGHTGVGNLPFDEALGLIADLLINRKVQKFGQNLKYDMKVLRKYGITIDPVSFDSMVASYVIDPSSREHSLSFMALKHFDYQMQPISQLIGKGKSQKTFDTVPIDTATFYAAEDADYTYRLRAVLAPRVKELELENLYYNIELPLIEVLASMEETGIRVDADYLAGLSSEMETDLTGLDVDIYKIAGGEFNINSTRQLSHVLFEKLGLPTKGKTRKKTGFSTDMKVLEELAQLHELPKLILERRQLSKLKSTYTDAIPRLISSKTGRVHTSFNQTIAATGRLSSTDPNLQNIPIRTEAGRRIRKAFIPRNADHILLVADYSQIELRILAHYSDDKGLIKAFKDGEDIHARTAAEVYGVNISDITLEMRRAAKTANFAVIYGVSAYGLSQQTELDLGESKEFIDTYFERYPGIRKYMDETKEFARSNGYVTTLFNRRRYLPDINSTNFNVRQFTERTAINSPIQGTAADMIKKGMLKIHSRTKTMRSKMVLQVHDELVVDVHKEELEEIRKIVVDGMEKAIKLKVPVVVDVGTGDNWLDAK